MKFDQPGLGFKRDRVDMPEGLRRRDRQDPRRAASASTRDTDKVKWIETISDNREPFLQEGKVDLVLASYSITDERRKVVGQAGPYMITGQQLLVTRTAKITAPPT